MMHLQSILWYGAWTLCVTLLYRRLIPTAWIAGLAGLIFAIDQAHSLPACWIAARTTVIAGFFAVVCLLLHDTARNRAAWPCSLLAAVAFALALLSKEAAIATCAYLLAYALLMDSGSIRSRLLTMAPYGVIVMIWQLAYRILGFGISSSELYVDPAGSPLRALKIIFERGPILLFGQWGFPPPETVWLLTPLARQIFWVVAILWLAALFYILVPPLKDQPAARYFFLGMLIATVPACMGMISGRMLEYVGIGGSALLAILLYALLNKHYSSRHALDRCLCRIFLPVLLVIHLIFAPIGFIVTHWTFRKPLTMRQETLTQAARIPQLAGKTVLLLNPPHASYASYLQIHRALAGKALPAHVWALAPGRFEHTRQTVHIKRLDLYRLQIKVQNGIPIQLERGRNQPLCIGDRIDLDGMTVTVSDIDSAGLPKTMVFTFPVPLESPSIVWLEILGKELSPWSPPRIGETILLVNRGEK
ncbi:MAG: protein kinase family protein [Planctomycetota bacterium]